jgi:predicted dehydrogenase
VSIRVTVIGGGHLGRIHAKLIQQVAGATLVAVCDPCEEARTRIEQDLAVETTADWYEVVDEIDAAIIATPTVLHHEIAVQLANRGIHLLIEKPITATVVQARHLLQITDYNQVQVQVGHVERFNAAYQNTRNRVGTPRFVQSTRASGYTFRSTDVGVVLDLMIHDIDLVCDLAQSPVREVRAVGVSVFGKNEDIAQARIQFENGFVANLTASRCSPKPCRSMDIFGSRGYAQIDFGTSSVNLISPPNWILNRQFDLDEVADEQKSVIREHLFEQIMPPVPIQIDPVNAILCEQQNWIDAIEQKEPLEVPARQGLRALEVAHDIVQQINEHRWTSHSHICGPLADPVAVEPSFGLATLGKAA